MNTFNDIKKLTRLDRFPLTAKITKRIKLSETNIELFLAIIVGIGAGYASVFFRFILHEMHHFFFGIVYPQLAEISEFLLPLIPMIGAVI